LQVRRELWHPLREASQQRPVEHVSEVGGELRRPQCLLQNHVPIPRLHGLGDDVGGFLQLRLVPGLPLTCIQSTPGLQQVGDVTLDESVHPFPLEGDALDAVSKLLKSAFQCRHQFSLPILTSSTSIRSPATAVGAAVAVTTWATISTGSGPSLSYRTTVGDRYSEPEPSRSNSSTMLSWSVSPRVPMFSTTVPDALVIFPNRRTATERTPQPTGSRSTRVTTSPLPTSVSVSPSSSAVNSVTRTSGDARAWTPAMDQSLPAAATLAASSDNPKALKLSDRSIPPPSPSSFSDSPRPVTIPEPESSRR